MITFLKSIIIGICALLPGVSGSVIAVTLGIYERFLVSIKNIKDNYLFILEVLLGIFVGVFFTSNIIIYIFKYQTIIFYILSGIILSELPFIIKKITINNGKVRIIPLLLAFFGSYLLEILKNNSVIINSKLNYFIGGILFSFGKIFPGISSSFFLLSLGIYKNIIILVTNPFLLISKLDLYFPFIIGTIVGLLLFYKLLSYLMNNKYDLTYSIIIGFIISSTIVLIPKFEFKLINILGIVLMISFFVIFICIKKKNDS